MVPASESQPPIRVTVIGRPGCHLCENAEVVVARVAAAAGVGWERVIIDTDPALLAAYAEQIPVVLVDGALHTYWRVDEARLQAALAGRRRWLDRFR